MIKNLLNIKSPSNTLSSGDLQKLKLSFDESCKATKKYCFYKIDYYEKIKNGQTNSD